MTNLIVIVFVVIVIGVWFAILLRISQSLRLNSPLTALFLIAASFGALVVVAKLGENLQENSTKTTPSPTSQAIESPAKESPLSEATRLAQLKKPLVKSTTCVDIFNRGSEQEGTDYLDCSFSKSHCLRVRELSEIGPEERRILEGKRSYCNTQGW